MESNLGTRSNLMIDDAEHRPQHKHIPGDFLKEVYPDLADSRCYTTELTKPQIVEMLQYLRCIRCGRPCAGTCGR